MPSLRLIAAGKTIWPLLETRAFWEVVAGVADAGIPGSATPATGGCRLRLLTVYWYAPLLSCVMLHFELQFSFGE
jgi:hypothetical protein